METTTDSDPRGNNGTAEPEDGPVVTIVDAPNPRIIGVRRRISAGKPIKLGRAATSSFPGAFEGSSVSRQHARIGYAPSRRVVVEDLGSRNGTRVNAVRIEGPTPLDDGDVVGVGDVMLLFHRGPRMVRVPRHPRLIGISAALADTLELVELVAERTTPVALVGQTGTGKELVAAEIHRLSGRRGELVSVNCAGMADTLLSSELFGHVRGAFTGADRDRKGLIETARGGTLFLDELTDASPSFQASLLRLFETGEYRPVGSDRAQTADVRFLAAVQPRVLDAVEEGSFRLDLWTRMARWVITLPPLGERPEDIPMLARHFAAKYSDGDVQFSRELMVTLMQQRWRGNIRELQGAIERLVVLSRGAGELDMTGWKKLGLGDPIASPPPTKVTTHEGASRKRKAPAQRPDKASLEQVLNENGGNMRQTAEALGVTRKTLYRWCEALELDPSSFR